MTRSTDASVLMLAFARVVGAGAGAGNPAPVPGSQQPGVPPGLRLPAIAPRRRRPRDGGHARRVLAGDGMPCAARRSTRLRSGKPVVQRQGTTTDGDGKWESPTFRPGRYTVSASKAGM